MCSLCGALGVEHWTEATAPSRPEEEGGTAPRRRQERLYRVRLANAVLEQFALRLEDWQGASFVLRSRTGRSAVVSDLSAVWSAAEGMLGRPLDPLDPELIAALERRIRGG